MIRVVSYAVSYDQVLVDTEIYNSGDVEEEAGDLGNGVHLHILNRGEFPYK
jgi:hypothetical protein